MRLLVGGGAALLASACAVWALGSVLSAAAPREIGPPPADLAAESCGFASESGSAIRCWLARGRAMGGGVVLAHSVRSNRLEMVGRAKLLHAAGYSVLLFDAQAHGESPGEQITFGHLESRDAAAAVAFLRERSPHEKIAYVGVSQGGAAALLGSAPLPVDALILEAVYPTLGDAVRDRIAIRLGPLAPVLAPLLLGQVSGWFREPRTRTSTSSPERNTSGACSTFSSARCTSATSKGARARPRARRSPGGCS